jgi:hypothetical protein
MELTVEVKLLTIAEQYTFRLKTMKAFNEACNYILQSKLPFPPLILLEPQALCSQGN